MHNLSKNYRRVIVSATAERLAEEVFKAERHNKSLCTSQWIEYRSCLNVAEQEIAIEAFNTRTKELEGDSGGNQEAEA